MRELGELRYEPIEKRIRGMLGGQAMIDSQRAMLVWEPGRVVPSYAVPVEDVHGDLGVASSSALDDRARDPEGTSESPHLAGRPVLDPSIPFSVHTTDGEELRIGSGGAKGGGADQHEALAFRPFDGALAGYVILDFDSFDAWYEEDERNVGHPRDPFHRIEIVHSSRQIRVEQEGEILAESTSPYMLFEPPLPVRYYLPPGDVSRDLLRPSTTTTFCAYKGRASYWSLERQPDIAWSYREPLREAAEVTGRIAFFNERVDLVVDGKLLGRPVTPWSRAPGHGR